METRTWPAPARLVGQRIAIHAGRRVVRQQGAAIERELRDRLGDDWQRTVPAGAVLATMTLTGTAKVERVDLLTDQAIRDVSTEIGHDVPLGGPTSCSPANTGGQNVDNDLSVRFCPLPESTRKCRVMDWNRAERPRDRSRSSVIGIPGSNGLPRHCRSTSRRHRFARGLFQRALTAALYDAGVSVEVKYVAYLERRIS